MIRGGFLRFVNSVLQFFLPLLLNSILSYFQRVQSGKVAEGDGAWAYYRGYWLPALLMAMIAARALTGGADGGRVLPQHELLLLEVSDEAFVPGIVLGAGCRIARFQ